MLQWSLLNVTVSSCPTFLSLETLASSIYLSLENLGLGKKTENPRVRAIVEAPGVVLWGLVDLNATHEMELRTCFRSRVCMFFFLQRMCAFWSGFFVFGLGSGAANVGGRRIVFECFCVFCQLRKTNFGFGDLCGV